MLLSHNQKQLILDILKKERRKLVSRYKGELLNKTIGDFEQTLRNERINSTDPRDNSIDWSSRK